MNDDELDEGGGFLDHFFNALGHASRAVRNANARAAEERDARRTRGPRKVKTPKAHAFDAAPDPSCCTKDR